METVRFVMLLEPQAAQAGGTVSFETSQFSSFYKRRKRGPREVKFLIQSHTASKWQSQDLNQTGQMSELAFL